MMKIWFEATPLQRINVLTGFAILACYMWLINYNPVAAYYGGWNWPMSIAWAFFWMSAASIIIEILRLIFKRK